MFKKANTVILFYQLHLEQKSRYLISDGFLSYCDIYITPQKRERILPEIIPELSEKALGLIDSRRGLYKNYLSDRPYEKI